MIFSSCSSWRSVKVYGKPETEIYDNEMNLLGTIQDEGYTKIKITRNGYTPFLISHNPTDGNYIPFAIDYESKNNRFKEILMLIAPFTVIGSIPMLATMGETCSHQFMNQYSYLPEQLTNEDVSFTKPKETGIARPHITTKTSVASSTSKTSVSKSIRTLKDYAQILAGNYIGSGVLEQNGYQIETYNSMTIILKKNNKDCVGIDVFDNDNIPFFETEQIYKIQKTANGYQLTLNDIPSAKIEINKDCNLQYYHPNIEIDGKIYTLKISAIKQ